MHKLVLSLAATLLFFTFTGCLSESNHNNPEKIIETISPIESSVPQIIIDDFFSTFTVPEEYTIEQVNDNTILIRKGEQVVGGIMLTDLDPACLKDTERENIREYIYSLASLPLSPEYVCMYSGDRIIASIRITNLETGESTEQSHTFFEHQSKCYDYWYDKLILDEKTGILLGKNIVY